MRIDVRQCAPHELSISQSRFARRLPTVDLLPPVEDGFQRNFMLEQPKYQIWELQIEKFRTPSSFLYWKMNFRTEVCSGSSSPAEAMLPWMKEVEMASSFVDLNTLQSIFGRQCQNFETLDTRIASGLKKIIQNSNFEKKIHFEEQKAPKEDRFLSGRQIAFLIHEYFRATGTCETILDFCDLMEATLCGDDVLGFDTRWDEVLLSIHEVPSDDILEGFLKTRSRESDQLKTVLALCDQDILQKYMPPGYHRLKNL